LIYRIASRLGKLPREIEQLEYSEMLEFAEFFEYEYRTHDKKDYYLAQIAQCCLIPYSKEMPKIKDFLVEFETKESKAEKIPKNLLCSILKAAFGIKEKNNGK
jgi:hypothetical protein